MLATKFHKMRLCVIAFGLSCLFMHNVNAQEGRLASVGTETRQLDRAIGKSRVLHARPALTDEQIVLELTDRLNKQESTHYTPAQVVEMLQITPAQMEMLRRGVGIDQIGISRHRAFVEVGDQKPAPAQTAQTEAPSKADGIGLNERTK